jgi:hypothetical protein
MLKAIGKMLRWYANRPMNYSSSSNNSSHWNEMNNNGFARVQVQDQSGMWRDTAATTHEPQVYLARMQEATQNHPGMRVRTVDDNGRLLDLF